MPNQAKVCLRLLPLVVVFTALAVSTSPSPQVVGQAPSLRIGGSDLRIGMPKDKVLSVLKADGFELLPQTESEKGTLELIVAHRSADKAGAEIYFENTKLIRIARLFDFQTEAEVMDTIYGLVAKFQKEGNRVCTLGARSDESGDRTHKTATFACGHKFIEINIVQKSGGAVLVLNISEGLSDSVLP